MAAELEIDLKGANVQDALDAIQQAMNEVGVRVLEVGANYVVGTAPASFLSFGEAVEVRVHRGTIHISSIPKAQLMDWGKSRTNVESLAVQISRKLER